MSETGEKIISAPSQSVEQVYESPLSETDDDFWLEHGRRILSESLTNVRNAANALMTALGVLQGIYLGILGFAKFIPEDLPLPEKMLFLLPLVLWLVALYWCITVAMTERESIYLNSPNDIRDKTIRFIERKQRYLELAFWLLAIGLIAAFALLIFRMKM